MKILILIALFALHALPTARAQVSSADQNLKGTQNLALTAALGLPQPLSLGIQTHRRGQPNFDVFYQVGFFKYPLTESTRSGSDYTIELGARYHPFANAFYLAGELGFRHLGLNVDISNLKQDGVALANTATLSLGTFFAGLLVGGEWQWSKHFGIACDLGLQLALIHTGGITINPVPGQDDGTDLSVDDQKEMKRISGLPLPQIAVFRFVWYL